MHLRRDFFEPPLKLRSATLRPDEQAAGARTQAGGRADGQTDS